MFAIDLNELAKRESERVEWKENVASIEDVVKTAVAFANDFSNLGGGYIVCGAREGKDSAGFQKVHFDGLTSSRIKELDGQLLAHCREKVDPPIVPHTEELPTPDPARRVLVFIIPATEQAHCYRPSGKDSSTYYIRIGRETREARNGLLRELLVRKKAVDPWDRRVNHTAALSDIDLLTLRDYLQSMSLWEPNKAIEDYLSPDHQLSSFVPPLTGHRPLTDIVYPRNFTLLMFCRNPTLFFPGAYSIFSVYPGTDRSEPLAERIEITGTIVDQSKKLIERLNTESYTAFDKTSSRPNLQKYPVRALQEAVVNAIVHRDYELDQPVRVTVFSDRVEVHSPGALVRTINRSKFVEGKATPFWRNQSLAYFFNKLQLAQAEGQGIPTILRSMNEAGCPSPVFELDEESVVCVLPAHPRHQQLRDLREIEQRIILGHHLDALVRLEEMLDADPYNFRCIELYCEVCNLLVDPMRLLSFFKKAKIDLSKLSPACLIVCANTLLDVEQNREAADLAKRMLSYASDGRLEETEIRKVAVGIRKSGDDEKAVRFLDEALKRSAALSENASLLDIRAKAKIDLAKRCMETARNSKPSPQMKRRAWDECRAYLSSAEKDLLKALEHVSHPLEDEYIHKDLDFLRRLQHMATPPVQRRGRHNGR